MENRIITSLVQIVLGLIAVWSIYVCVRDLKA